MAKCVECGQELFGSNTGTLDNPLCISCYKKMANEYGTIVTSENITLLYTELNDQNFPVKFKLLFSKLNIFLILSGISYLVYFFCNSENQRGLNIVVAINSIIIGFLSVLYTSWYKFSSKKRLTSLAKQTKLDNEQMDCGLRSIISSHNPINCGSNTINDVSKSTKSSDFIDITANISNDEIAAFVKPNYIEKK